MQTSCDAYQWWRSCHVQNRILQFISCLSSFPAISVAEFYMNFVSVACVILRPMFMTYMLYMYIQPCVQQKLCQSRRSPWFISLIANKRSGALKLRLAKCPSIGFCLLCIKQRHIGLALTTCVFSGF